MTACDVAIGICLLDCLRQTVRCELDKSLRVFGSTIEVGTNLKIVQQRLLRKEVLIHLTTQFAVNRHGDVLANHQDAFRHRPVVNLELVGCQSAAGLDFEVLVLLQLAHLDSRIDNVPEASHLIGGVAHAVLCLDSLDNNSQQVFVGERKVDVITDGQESSQRHLPVSHDAVQDTLTIQTLLQIIRCLFPGIAEAGLKLLPMLQQLKGDVGCTYLAHAFQFLEVLLLLTCMLTLVEGEIDESAEEGDICSRHLLASEDDA